MCNKMSHVRLSNASPTVERVDARHPDNVRPPVRRALFGTPDREETQRYFAASIQEGVQAFRETYNFDPVSERPLTPRRYEWQADSDAPEFFTRPPHRREEQPRGEVDLPGESTRQDAAEEETSGRQSGRQPEREGSRKRRSGAPGPCSSECPSKRSLTDEEDDDDEEEQTGGATSQSVVVVAEEERENSGEFQ